MTKQEEHEFRLMTYNIGGGRRDFGSSLGKIIQVVQDAAPDVLVVQEATRFQDADGNWHSPLDQTAHIGELQVKNHVHFGRTLSMREHMHVQKSLFVESIFNDWLDWQQGNAILSQWEFMRLGDPSKPGVPRNVPLYQAPLYQGNRDTDPRYALLARVGKAPIFPFVVGTHLTTLVGERGSHSLPGKDEEAQSMRLEQARRLLDLLRVHVLEREEVVFVLGDFNAVASEPCISSVLEGEGGFVHLTPTRGPNYTHPKVPDGPIDHIFMYPRSRLLEYDCWTVDSGASDHFPVVADVKVS
jgi:endonuclease/exonuclease/phosphatase family metal-dependent hydrolase